MWRAKPRIVFASSSSAKRAAISPAGLASPRELVWGRGVLLSMRWAARNLPSSEALLRNPVGRTLFAGPALGKPWRADPTDMIEQAELFGNAPGMLPTFEALEGRQPLGLTTLTVPVLLLWGTKDVILLPRQGRRFERLIPGSELRYLKGLGHTPMSDDPEGLAEAITAFALRRRSSSPAAAPA